MMELKETVDLMLSEDYEDRFRAEAARLSIRAQKLRDMIVKYEAKELPFEPMCPVDILNAQLKAMTQYLLILCARAGFEEIDLINIMRC